ncbi:MAG: type II secretion system F family protein [Candidatus Omnitrophota bacterium]
MPIYAYKARDGQGELINGSLEAENKLRAVADLDKLGYSIVEITIQKNSFSLISAIFSHFQRLHKQEVVIFTRQLATLVRSGMALSPSLNTICEQTINKKFKSILGNIRQSVQEGDSFSKALAVYPAIFPEIFVSMVEVGEAGGMLDKVLDRLAKMSLRELEISSSIKSALIYPVVLVIVAFAVVNFLLVGVLPKFVMVFQASQAKLPLPTQIVLGLSGALRVLWLPILFGVGMGVFGFKRYIRNDEGKFKFHKWLLKLPIFGKLYAKIQVSQFARILAALTSSGIPILQGLVVAEKTVTNVVVRRSIQNIRVAITEGQSLEAAFKLSGFFSPMVVQMVSTGEKAGKIDQMLEEISFFYDPEIEYTIKNLTSLLEPFMLLAMGGMVAFIALSVLLPIFNLIKVFRG